MLAAVARDGTGLSILLHQFQSLIVLLLVAATVVAFALGENVEAVAILVVIVLNAAIGFLTEWKAEQALSALQKHGRRRGPRGPGRGGAQIPAAELVPGDVVLAAGAGSPPTGGSSRAPGCRSRRRP